MLRLNRTIIVLSLIAFAISFLFTVNGVAQAHGHVNVGDYELTIGFMVEPALVGEPNGLDLRVVKVASEAEDHEEGEEDHAEATEEAADHGHGESTPVSGLEDTLQAEIIYGSQTRELELRPVFGTEGEYTADIIPMATGDYTFHIWGEIEGTPVDVELTSAPDTFASIEAKDALMFPTDAGSAESGLAAQVRMAQMIAIAGVVLGGIGVVLGIMGMRGKRA